MAIETTISSQIYLSRDSIRSQITDYLKVYLELENVDLTKSSFLSFMIDIVSTLTTNLLFYQSSVYKEFFLTKAQLPESIYNLSAFLGYNTKEASYSVVYALLTVPMEFGSSATFTIPEGFKFYADSIEFVTYYSTTVTITGSSVTAVITEGNRVYNIPVTIDAGPDPENFYFVLPLRQYKLDLQEFQIDSDLKPYQFTTVDVPLDGKVSEMAVYVRPPGSTTEKLYTEFDSLYLMAPTDYGYVSRRTDEGRAIHFGNGLIGVQPEPGSTVRVVAKVTEGADGNIIAGSITKGDRVYTTSGGTTQVVKYEVTNTSPATGGEDEESFEDIRKNSIASLTALGRLVAEQDFQNADVVIDDSPLASNSIAVLKRSDVRVNDIQLYTALEYGTDVVPTRNVYTSFPLTTTYVPRGTSITFGGEDYYTLFDMTIDADLNETAYYNYIMYEIEQTPLLEETFVPAGTYDILATNFLASRSGNTAIYNLTYTSSESDSDTCTCEMEISETSELFAMTNDSTSLEFTYTFNPYTTISEGELKYMFTISHPTHGQISQYSTSFTFRQDLKPFMLSNVGVDATAGIVIVYDIPCIQKSYYDDLVTNGKDRDFEVLVMQTMMSSMDFSGYRMLTDFVNVKFTNTIGNMVNMLLNSTTKPAVADMELTSVPVAPTQGARYIVSGLEGGDWAGHKNDVAECTDSTSVTWVFYEPTTDDVIYVASRHMRYMYSETGWVLPRYDLPLQIELEAFKDSTYTGSDSDLSEAIKTALLDEFSSRFGSNVTIFRSEIIDVVQEVEGVEHCRLVAPESSIFFNFNIDDFTEQQLLEYSPEYVYFTEDDITLRVL